MGYLYLLPLGLRDAEEGGLMFCSCFLFLPLYVKPITSTSTGPTFAKLAGLVEL